MKKKTQAFTLAEALILLLIAALIAAALVPVITRKHREVGEHGKWICTINNDGKHVIKSTLRGKVTKFILAQDGGEHCIFSPPPAAKNFTLKAVGGGGGGAGGTVGGTESVFDSRTAGNTFAGVVDADSSYNVIIAGSGGGGGGMSCGDATQQATTNLNLENDAIFEEQSSDHHGMYGQGNDWSWNESTQQHSNPSPVSWCPKKSSIGYDVDCSKSENSKSEDPYHPKYYQYGYVDHQLPGFKYNLLFQNDKKYTDKYNYGQQDAEARYTNERAEWVGNISVYDFKYKYLDYDSIGYQEQELKDRIMCFAEKNWPLSKEVNNDKGLYLTDNDPSKPSIKCWNLPGMGGHKGDQENALDSAELKAGESIYVTVGSAGVGQAKSSTHRVSVFLPDDSGALTLRQNENSVDGDIGTDGEDTILQLGGQKIVAEGGQGGAARYLIELPSYKNIPVYEYEVYPIESSGFLDEPTGAAGVDGAQTTNSSFCTSTPKHTCSANAICINWVSKTCKGTGTNSDGSSYTYTYDCSYCADTQQWYQCSCSKHTGISSYGLRNPQQRVRPKYFDQPSYGINICLYSAEVPDELPEPPSGGKGDVMDLDFPYLNPEVTESSIESSETEHYYLEGGRKKFEGSPGSGGYGAGELIRSYIDIDDNTNKAIAKFIGQDGSQGYVAIVKSNAYGGTGGQAGQYVSTMVKKLSKLKITIGLSGAPAGVNSDGNPGHETIIKEYNRDIGDYEDMFVLQGGLAGQTKKLTRMASSTVVAGGDGAASPVENESNRAKVIPRGGYSNNNNDYSGQTAAISNIWGLASTPSTAFGSTSGVNLILNITGGHPLDMTYGAGGGGGAAGETQAGGGGGGTPGAVIIEW